MPPRPAPALRVKPGDARHVGAREQTAADRIPDRDNTQAGDVGQDLLTADPQLPREAAGRVPGLHAACCIPSPRANLLL